MSAVPEWIQILQALLTPTIAIAVGVIGFLQWRTAHQKVMLDLFERRLALVDSARSAAWKVVTEKGGDFETATGIATDVTIRSRFLFGSEIVKILAEFRGDVYRATEMGGLTETTSDAERIAIAKDAARGILKDLNNMAERYMRMDQALIRTPAQWLHDRNKIRLSFDDQK